MSDGNIELFSCYIYAKPIVIHYNQAMNSEAFKKIKPVVPDLQMSKSY